MLQHTKLTTLNTYVPGLTISFDNDYRPKDLDLCSCIRRNATSPGLDDKIPTFLHMMPRDLSGVDRISSRYNDSSDEGREQLFEDLFASFYNGVQSAADELAKALQVILIATDMLPKEANGDTMHIQIMQVNSNRPTKQAAPTSRVSLPCSRMMSVVNFVTDLSYCKHKQILIGQQSMRQDSATPSALDSKAL